MKLSEFLPVGLLNVLAPIVTSFVILVLLNHGARRWI
jgi:hypothetical protein